MSYDGRIALLPGQSPAEELATLIHEAGHEVLHRAIDEPTRTVRELEAEAVAFVVGQAAGLEMGTTSADYIKLYNRDAAMLAESLEAIQNASTVVLAAILPTGAGTDRQSLRRPFTPPQWCWIHCFATTSACTRSCFFTMRHEEPLRL